jgi:hypothetical protein
VADYDVTVPAPQVVEVSVGGRGPAGPGVAEGGATGELLVKQSATDFDTAWTDRPAVARLSFETNGAPTLDAAGDLAWDDLDQALSYRTNGITVDIAQENLIYVRNGPAETPISKGMAVSFEGAAANRINVKPCVANVPGVGCATAGVALTDIPSPGFGFVSTFGLVRGFDTTQILTDGGPPVTEGQELFISTTPGTLATFPAVSPARRVTVGYVVTTGTNGSVFVTVRRGIGIAEADDVIVTNPQPGDVLTFDGTVWRNVQP